MQVLLDLYNQRPGVAEKTDTTLQGEATIPYSILTLTNPS